MDGKYATLKLLMESLYQNNGLLDWNCFPQKNGKIMLKVQFKDGGQIVNKSDLMDSNCDQASPLPNDMSSKDKHNFLRAKSFRESKKKRTRSCVSDSPEICRNYEHCFDSSISSSHVGVTKDSPTREISMSSVDCTPLKSSDQSSLVDHEEPVTLSDLPACDKSDDLLFEECLSHDVEIAKPETNIEMNERFDPYDNDNDSVYSEDENKFPLLWRREVVNRPCIQPGCFYRPNQTIKLSEMNKKLGPRPDGSFKSYYKCDK